MPLELARNLFYALLAELITVASAILVKDDKRKLVLVLTTGTFVIGVLGFSTEIESVLSPWVTPILTPKPSGLTSVTQPTSVSNLTPIKTPSIEPTAFPSQTPVSASPNPIDQITEAASPWISLGQTVTDSIFRTGLVVVGALCLLNILVGGILVLITLRAPGSK